METSSIVLFGSWPLIGLMAFFLSFAKRDNTHMEFWPKMGEYFFLPLELLVLMIGGPISLVGVVFSEGVRYCPHCHNCVRKRQTVCVYCHRDI